MPTIESSLDLLRSAIQQDPSLQDRLFALQNADEFLAALAGLAMETGHAVTEDQLKEALRQGRREWVERDLPW